MPKIVQSPLPGIFYRKPEPNAANYVNDGEEVAEGQTIGLVEVMKTFHEVKSDQSGVNARFKVQNEDPVMAGQTLLELD